MQEQIDVHNLVKAVTLHPSIDHNGDYVNSFVAYAQRVVKYASDDSNSPISIKQYRSMRSFEKASRYDLPKVFDKERRQENRLVAYEHVPAIVLAVHVQLDFSTDPEAIYNNLCDMHHIYSISKTVISLLLPWSLHVISHTVNNDKPPCDNELKASIEKHHSLLSLASQPWGVSLNIHFGLFHINRDNYTVLFIDSYSQKFAFTAPFKAHSPHTLNLNLHKAVHNFMVTYEPGILLFINPTIYHHQWMANVLQESLMGPTASKGYYSILRTVGRRRLPSSVAQVLSRAVKSMVAAPNAIEFVKDSCFPDRMAKMVHNCEFVAGAGYRSNKECQVTKKRRVVRETFLEFGDCQSVDVDVWKHIGFSKPGLPGTSRQYGYPSNFGISTSASLRQMARDDLFASPLYRGCKEAVFLEPSTRVVVAHIMATYRAGKVYKSKHRKSTMDVYWLYWNNCFDPDLHSNGTPVRLLVDSDIDVSDDSGAETNQLVTSSLDDSSDSEDDSAGDSTDGSACDPGDSLKEETSSCEAPPSETTNLSYSEEDSFRDFLVREEKSGDSEQGKKRMRSDLDEWDSLVSATESTKNHIKLEYENLAVSRAQLTKIKSDYKQAKRMYNTIARSFKKEVEAAKESLTEKVTALQNIRDKYP